MTTDPDFSPIDMWDTREVQSDATSVEYEGSPLSDGNVYYIRGKVSNTQIWSHWSSLSFRMNSVPSVPVPLSPVNDDIVLATPVVLTIPNGSDAEGDALMYSFEVYSDSNMAIFVDSVSNVAEGADSTSWEIGATLSDNRQYWWRTSASDSYEHSEFSDAVSFLLNARNDDPESFSLLTPSGGEEVTTLAPILDWEDAADPDPLDVVNYTLLLGREIPNLISLDVGLESVIP